MAIPYQLSAELHSVSTLLPIMTFLAPFIAIGVFPSELLMPTLRRLSCLIYMIPMQSLTVKDMVVSLFVIGCYVNFTNTFADYTTKAGYSSLVNPMEPINLNMRAGTRHKLLKIYAIQYQLTNSNGDKQLKDVHKIYTPTVAQPDASWPIAVEVCFISCIFLITIPFLTGVMSYKEYHIDAG